MDKTPKANPGFLSRNIVIIVMIPAMIGLHYAWDAMQKNKSLVKEEERIEMPVMTFVKYMKKKMLGNETSDVNTSGILPVKN